MTAQQKITEAMDMLLVTSPFFALQLGRLQLIEDTQNTELMKVNTKKLWYNPERIEKLPIGDICFILAHEVMHVVGKHSCRAVAIPSVQLPLFNVGADLAINSVLQRTIKRPTVASLLFPEEGQYKEMPLDMEAEWYYEKLVKEAKEEEKKEEDSDGEKEDSEDSEEGESDGDSEDSDDESGDDEELSDGESGSAGEPSGGDDGSSEGEDDNADGSGSGGMGSVDDSDGEGDRSERSESGISDSNSVIEKAKQALKEMADIKPATEGKEDLIQQEQEIDMNVAGDYQTAKGIGTGMSTALSTYLGKELTPPKIPWQRALRMFLNAREYRKYRYGRPNRRQFREDVVLPSRGNRTMGNVCIVADTSGSMSSKLPKIVKEMESICVSFPNSVLTLIEVDTAVRGVRRIGKGNAPIDWSQFKWSGLGGTDLCPGVDEAMRQKPPPTFIIIATDFYLPREPSNPKVPVVWLLTSEYGKPSYGNVIRM